MTTLLELSSENSKYHGFTGRKCLYVTVLLLMKAEILPRQNGKLVPNEICSATTLLTSAEYLAVFFSRFNSLCNYWKVFLIHINFSNIHQGWLEPEKTLYNMNPWNQRSLQNIKCIKTQAKHWLSFLFLSLKPECIAA